MRLNQPASDSQAVVDAKRHLKQLNVAILPECHRPADRLVHFRHVVALIYEITKTIEWLCCQLVTSVTQRTSREYYVLSCSAEQLTELRSDNGVGNPTMGSADWGAFSCSDRFGRELMNPGPGPGLVIGL